MFHGAEADDLLSFAVVGDLQGDGASDIVLFAVAADGPGNMRQDAGEAYLFFGPPSAWPRREMDLRVDVPDVHILGADGDADNVPGAGDSFGLNFAVGDVLGDGVADLIVLAGNGAGPRDNLVANGEVYVIRGRSAWPAAIDLRFEAPDLLIYGSVDRANLNAVRRATGTTTARPTSSSRRL